MTDRTALYRLYDSFNRLLYVGITGDLEQRWMGHQYSPTSTWWPKVHRKVIEWHPTREAADAAETAVITNEKPLHNKAKVPGGYVVRPSRLSPDLEVGNPHLPYSKQAIKILSSEIGSGVIAPGAVIPTAKELHRRFGLSANTCGGMLRAMAAQGLIHQKAKGGRYYCAGPEHAAPVEPTAPSKAPTPRELAARVQAVAVDGIRVNAVERRTRARGFSRTVLGAQLQMRPYSPDPALRRPHANVEVGPNEVVELDSEGLAALIDRLEAQCAALWELHDHLTAAEQHHAA